MLSLKTYTPERHNALLASHDDCFAERAASGRQLAELLGRYRGGRAVVLALPPGGVAVAGEVARALRLPLDVLVARAFSLRRYPTLAAGALSEAGGLCFNGALLRLPGVSMAAIWREARRAANELAALVQHYRQGRPLHIISRRPVIIVDDGLTSGLPQLAALQALRHYHPQSCIVATPRGTAEALQLVGEWADTLVTLADAGDTPGGVLWQPDCSHEEASALLGSYRIRSVVA